jgi:hypothetical protein
MASKKTSAKNIVVSTGAPAPPRKRIARPHSLKPAETPDTAAAAQEPTLAAAPSQDEIATLAYLFWEARGCQGGSPEEDWIRAEQELRTRACAALA